MIKNWYGFDHEAVNKKLGTKLTYLNDFCVLGEYSPVAVYHQTNPDLSKGHKEFVLLTSKFIRGMTKEEIEPFRFQDAIQCENCKDIIYSVMRHDNCFCNCEKVSIDGGKDYTKISNEPGSKYILGTIDLLTNEFKSENS